MEIRARHWLIALTMAGAAHGSLLLLPTQSAPSQAPEPVYRIQLAAAEPLGADKAPGDAAASPPPAPVPAQPPPAPASAAVASPPAPIEAPKVQKRAPVEPKPAPRAKKKAPPKESKRPVKRRQVRPKPSPVESQVRGPARPALEAAASANRSNAVSSTSRGGGTATRMSPNQSQTGQGAAGSGRGSGKRGGKGSSPASARSYYSTLAAWLARHKRYPTQARRRQEQGTVRLTFTIDRQGRLLSHRIAASSGHPLLDQEVKAMVQRASPMPSIPAALGKSRLTITVPISFTLR